MSESERYYHDLLRILKCTPVGYDEWEGGKPRRVFMLYAEELDALLNATPEQRTLAERTALFSGWGGR